MNKTTIILLGLIFMVNALGQVKAIDFPVSVNDTGTNWIVLNWTGYDPTIMCTDIINYTNVTVPVANYSNFSNYSYYSNYSQFTNLSNINVNVTQGIIRRSINGTEHYYHSNNTDSDRGLMLLQVFNDSQDKDTIIIGKGTYMISGSIAIKKNLTIIGEGEDSYIYETIINGNLFTSSVEWTSLTLENFKVSAFVPFLFETSGTQTKYVTFKNIHVVQFEIPDFEDKPIIDGIYLNSATGTGLTNLYVYDSNFETNYDCIMLSSSGGVNAVFINSQCINTPNPSAGEIDGGLSMVSNNNVTFINQYASGYQHIIRIASNGENNTINAYNSYFDIRNETELFWLGSGANNHITLSDTYYNESKLTNYNDITVTNNYARNTNIKGNINQTNGTVTFQNDENETAWLGTNLITNGGFSSTDNWTWGTNWALTSGRALHTSGSTETLNQTITGLKNNTLYKITFTTLTGSWGSGLNITLGGTNWITETSGTSKIAYITTREAGYNDEKLVFTPYSDFTKAIDNVNVYEVTGTNPNLIINYNSGNPAMEIRNGGEGQKNVYFGLDAGKYGVGTGENTAIGGNVLKYTQSWDNTGIGYNTLSSLKTGGANTAIGYGTLMSLITGSYNTGIGSGTMIETTSGSRNTAIGTNVLYNANGNDNLAIGLQAGMGMHTGDGNTFIGNNVAVNPTYNSWNISKNIIIGNGSMNPVYNDTWGNIWIGNNIQHENYSYYLDINGILQGNMTNGTYGLNGTLNTTGYYVNNTIGLSQTITIQKDLVSTCTITFTGGLATSTTC